MLSTHANFALCDAITLTTFTLSDDVVLIVPERNRLQRDSVSPLIQLVSSSFV